MKVVLNKSEELFGLSGKALSMYNELSGNSVQVDYEYDLEQVRHDPYLVQVVEQLGEEVNVDGSNLVIVEVPDGCEYSIEFDNSGYEYISTYVEVTTKELREGLSGSLLELVGKVDFVKVKG